MTTPIKQYDIDYLLERLYYNLGNVSKTKVILARPEVNILNKKTNMLNFRVICNQLNRSEQDILKYFEKETSTSISINADGVLIITGIYRLPKIEQILRNYIVENVQCNMCKSLETSIHKKSKNIILDCSKCHATRSLSA